MSKEETTPIPGPAGDTDPATQEWRKGNWVEAGASEHPKAEAMAHAGDFSRTQEAGFKKEGDSLDESIQNTYVYSSEALDDRYRAQSLETYWGKSARHLEDQAGKKFDEEKAAEVAKRELGETNPRIAIEPEEPEEQQEES